MNQHKRCVLEGGLTSYLNATLETLSVLPHQRLPLSPSYKCRPFAPDSPFPPGGGDGNPLQYPCWGNPTYRGAWRATGRGVAESVMTESLRTLFPASGLLSRSLVQKTSVRPGHPSSVSRWWWRFSAAELRQ